MNFLLNNWSENFRSFSTILPVFPIAICDCFLPQWNKSWQIRWPAIAKCTINRNNITDNPQNCTELNWIHSQFIDRELQVTSVAGEMVYVTIMTFETSLRKWTFSIKHQTDQGFVRKTDERYNEGRCDKVCSSGRTTEQWNTSYIERGFLQFVVFVKSKRNFFTTGKLENCWTRQLPPVVNR